MTHRTGVVAAIVSAACFGVLAVLGSLAYERGVEPLQLLTWRFGIAFVLLGAWTAVRRPEGLRVPIADLGRFALLSVAGYGAASLCFFFALTYAPASIVGILLYTYPAMVAAAESLGRDALRVKGRITAIALTFAGCVLVVDPFSGSGAIHPLGVVLGLGAGAGYASFSILSHRWLPGRSRSVMMSYLVLFTALLAATAALVTRSTLSPGAWDVGSWALLAAIVVFPTFVAILLYWAAIRALGVSQAALLSTFEPLFTIVFAALLLGERLGPVQWAGAVLVLAGVVVAELGTSSSEALAAV